MSEHERAEKQSGYGHPEADWTDDEGPGRRDAEGERDRNGERADDEEEDEPPDADATPGPGEELRRTWSQSQGRYPAQERPRDQADTAAAEPAPAGVDALADVPDPPAEPADPRDDGAGVERRPHAPDATTADEGGGSDAELREEDDRRVGKPRRKSPARERKRAG